VWPPTEASAPQAAPIVGTISSEAEELPARRRESSTPVTTVKALPVVRKLAKDLGVDLAAVTGTGPDGRVTREDVLEAAEAVAESEVPAPSPPPPPSEDERRPLTKLRRTIAANMTASWTTIPHVTTFDEVDATRLLAVRDALGRRHGTTIPVDALVVKAVIPALVTFPEFNSTLDGDDLIVHHRHDIGVAVDTPEGLVVAVIRDARRRSLLGLAEEVKRLGEGAKQRRLAPEELVGQTFTVSNIGAVGGGFGTPLVPPGTVAILSVGRAVERPVAKGGRVEIAPLMPLSLSYDHRVVDGGLGRRFMAMVLENLAEPGLFLAE
jgi:pyruvate dehydrogenase E2 component (dihydrolipoamide acetyltransferase)